MITFTEARSRCLAKLATQPDGELWHSDWSADRSEAIFYLANTGRRGLYGEHFEALSDPLALNLPGAQRRTDSAVIAAVEAAGWRVKGNLRDFVLEVNGEPMRACELAQRLLAELGSDASQELRYAAERLSSSGTHDGGTTGRLASHWRR